MTTLRFVEHGSARAILIAAESVVAIAEAPWTQTYMGASHREGCVLICAGGLEFHIIDTPELARKRLGWPEVKHQVKEG